MVKKREKMPYALMEEIFAGRLGLKGCSIIITSLNICVDSSIRFLFRYLSPQGL